MRNNSFGVLVEAWADYAAQGPLHLNYYEVIGCLFPSHPSVSVTSRMKSTQPLNKTLARFVFETSTAYGFEQSLLIPNRIQPKFIPELDHSDLKEYIWDVLSCIADGDTDSDEEVNLLSNLLSADYAAGAFKRGFCDKVMEGFAEIFDPSVMRKLKSYMNQIDDSTVYSRFELFAVLFFASLDGEEGVDAILSCGLPANLSPHSSTPIMDSYAIRSPMIECGFSLSQLEIGPDGRPRVLKEWDYADGSLEVIIGREGPDVVLVPPSDGPWAVSRHQARVYVKDDGSYCVEDLSLNGTALRTSNETVMLRHSSNVLLNGDILMLAPLQETASGTVSYVENWTRGSVLRFQILRRQEK